MTTIRRINCKTDNCYLVANGKKAILVDTCSGEGYDTVLAACSGYDLQLVVLTHVHFDHAENAARIAKHFDIPVALESGRSITGTDGPPGTARNH